MQNRPIRHRTENGVKEMLMQHFARTYSHTIKATFRIPSYYNLDIVRYDGDIFQMIFYIGNDSEIVKKVYIDYIHPLIAINIENGQEIIDSSI